MEMYYFQYHKCSNPYTNVFFVLIEIVDYEDNKDHFNPNIVPFAFVFFIEDKNENHFSPKYFEKEKKYLNSC